mmetsp:Transcript_22673/g.52360  ORF Transcript_22673/g.52360 Transcript_22673/m.52360 type:complete len:171 (+) Transcript_22673:2233-2745(+)
MKGMLCSGSCFDPATSMASPLQLWDLATRSANSNSRIAKLLRSAPRLGHTCTGIGRLPTETVMNVIVNCNWAPPGDTNDMLTTPSFPPNVAHNINESGSKTQTNSPRKQAQEHGSFGSNQLNNKQFSRGRPPFRRLAPVALHQYPIAGPPAWRCEPGVQRRHPKLYGTVL